MATDSYGMGIPLPADSTKIHEFPKVARAGFEKVAEVLSEGLTDAARVVVEAEAELAVGKEIASGRVLAGDDPRVPTLGHEPAFLGGILDKDNLETWLGARTSDGGPTATAEAHLRRRLGIGQEETGLDLLFALLDARDELTDLAVRKSDGQFPDYVVNRLAPRIGARLGSSNAADYFMDGGTLRRLQPDSKRAAVWGSSTTELLGPFLAAMFGDLGVPVFHQGGKGAERGEHTVARLGSIPALLTIPGGVLPASGSVTVSSSNMQTWQGLREYEGRLAGVLCTLSSTASVMTLTRKTAGAAVTVPANTPFYPTLGPTYREGVNLINLGKNSITGLAGPASTAAQIITQIDTTFDWFSPLVKRVLVLGHFVDTNGMTDSMIANIHAVNAHCANRYGPLFVDVQAFLMSSKLWEYAGLTPTSNDRTQQAAGRKPSSVSADDSHLNTAGNNAVTRLIREHLLTLKWYGDN